MENKNTSETLTPEQMESGKWYVVETETQKYLINFKAIINSYIQFYRNAWNYNANGLCGSFYLCHISSLKSIILATKEEVLKYFPYEVFEPIELRPEDLKAGEVYVATFRYGDHYKFIFKHRDTLKNQVNYEKMINHSLQRFENANLDKSFKFYHATPEEKALLGEEQTDWEAKYNELKANYEKLSTYNDEITEKINQLEPKGEKVYFCNTHKGYQIGGLNWAILNSREQESIYEAVCIGKKKSVLIDEL